MTTSLVYRSAVVYELLTRALYGDRMRAVADQVPDGASVLELCCGPGTLYRRYLHVRTRAYVGIDVNRRFVDRLRRRGIDARRLDLGSGAGDPLPRADAVIMQASLYHFLRDPERILDAMLAPSRDRVSVSEPVRNSPRVPCRRSAASAETPPTRASAATVSDSLRRRSRP